MSERAVFRPVESTRIGLSRGCVLRAKLGYGGNGEGRNVTVTHEGTIYRITELLLVPLLPVTLYSMRSTLLYFAFVCLAIILPVPVD